VENIMSATPLAVEACEFDFSGRLARATPFADLPPAALKAISDIAQFRRYAAGEPVFALGQHDGSEFFYVASGRLKAAAPDRDGGAMIVDEICEGHFFGLADAIAEGDTARAELATLTAETDAEVVSIDAALFRQVVAQRPSLTRNLMFYFARALAAGAGQAPAAESSPERRIFCALMKRIKRDAVSGDWRIARMPKHREIADESGVDEHVAAAAIALLIQDGVARREYPGLVIADMGRFAKLAE
jgi:CRP-like cAMP-binding protein